MIAKSRYLLIHKATVRALLDLSDPTKSVRKPLYKGQAAGKLDIFHQLYPPRGVHRSSIPATFTFILEDWVCHEIDLMISLVDTEGCDGGLILGFIAHDHWAMITKKTGVVIDGQEHFVAIGYNIETRAGWVYLYKQAYAVLAQLHELDLKRAQESKTALAKTTTRR